MKITNIDDLKVGMKVKMSKEVIDLLCLPQRYAEEVTIFYKEYLEEYESYEIHIGLENPDHLLSVDEEGCLSEKYYNYDSSALSYVFQTLETTKHTSGCNCEKPDIVTSWVYFPTNTFLYCRNCKKEVL